MTNPVQKIIIDDLTLRCFQKDDASLVKEAIDSNLKHLRKFLDWAHKEPQPLKIKIEKVYKWEKEYKENIDYTIGIFKNEELIGSCGLHNRLKGNALEIGYWIVEDEINKGYATKTVLALTKLAFDYIQLDRIEIHMYKNNLASKKIPEKLNYKKMLDYSFEDEDDSSWYVLHKKEYETNKATYNTMYNSICFYKF